MGINRRPALVRRIVRRVKQRVLFSHLLTHHGRALASMLCFLACALVGTPVRAQDLLLVPRYLDQGLELRRQGHVEEGIRYFRLAITADSTYARAWFELGYALNELGRREEALAAFHGGLRQEPKNTLAWRQLGYWYSESDSHKASLAAFDAAGALGAIEPRDLLTIADVRRRAGDRKGALETLAQAQQSPDTSVARRARASINTMTASIAPNAATSAGPGEIIASASGWIRPIFMDFYAAPLYQTRFNNAIAQLVMRVGVVTEERTSFSPYLSLKVTRDTRSRGGAQPVIFSDNIAVPAIGARVQPLKPWGINSVYLYGEAGAAIELVDAGQAQRVRGDLRAGGFYLGQWRTGKALPTNRTPMLLISDVYSDVSYYSRVSNTVGSIQLRESLRMYENGGRGVDLYGRAWTVADAQRVYYNNAIELAGGIALYPETQRRVVILIERLHGRYLIAPEPGRPSSYDDARVTIVLSAYRWIGSRQK
jgi:cytochrome c-type biogenesis protein CcmH/NrfG